LESVHTAMSYEDELADHHGSETLATAVMAITLAIWVNFLVSICVRPWTEVEYRFNTCRR